MGWAIGAGAGNGGRDIGYGVPALCDQPDCDEVIDRGISYACGSFRAEAGCGQYFCSKHLSYYYSDDEEEHGYDDGCEFCDHCLYFLNHPNAKYDSKKAPPYHEPKPDLLKWILWKRYDRSWEQWRKESPKDVEALDKQINASVPLYVTGLMLELVPQMEQNQAEVSDMATTDPEAVTELLKSAQDTAPTSVNKEEE